MKVRDSGMPDESLWESFFDPGAVLDRVGLRKIDGDIVEFGCGYGTFTLPAARRCSGVVHALDIDEAMVRHVRERAGEAGIGNITAVVRDFLGEGTGLADSSAAVVLAFNILHLEQPDRLLAAARRVLRPEGIVAVIHWNYDLATTRGPSLDIRPRPEDCRRWCEAAGLICLAPGIVDLPPYHYGLVFRKPN